MSKRRRSTRQTIAQYSILENLFNSKIRIKVLKFLFRNYPINIGAGDLAERIQENPGDVREEMRELQKIGLINKV